MDDNYGSRRVFLKIDEKYQSLVNSSGSGLKTNIISVDTVESERKPKAIFEKEVQKSGISGNM